MGCQSLFRTPVTLSCGHTFDRDCLQKMLRRVCPIDQQPFTTPLPEVDFTLRSYIDSRVIQVNSDPADSLSCIAKAGTPEQQQLKSAGISQLLFKSSFKY